MKIVRQMVNLEKYDLCTWWIYENKLKILFDASQKQIKAKIENWTKIKAFLSKNTKPKDTEELATDFSNDNSNLNNCEKNNSPPDFDLLQEKLKSLL